jgi:hypothetical protein
MTEIDLEKDHLAIKRKDGKFYCFDWYPFDKCTGEELLKRAANFNGEDVRKHDGFSYEIITDPLVREICAYRKYSRPYQDIIDDVKAVQESINKAVKGLEYALEDLNRIRGLG